MKMKPLVLKRSEFPYSDNDYIKHVNKKLNEILIGFLEAKFGRVPYAEEIANKLGRIVYDKADNKKLDMFKTYPKAFRVEITMWEQKPIMSVVRSKDEVIIEEHYTKDDPTSAT